MKHTEHEIVVNHPQPSRFLTEDLRPGDVVQLAKDVDALYMVLNLNSAATLNPMANKYSMGKPIPLLLLGETPSLRGWVTYWSSPEVYRVVKRVSIEVE